VAERPLTPDEAALWAKVMATVRPIRPAPKAAPKAAVQAQSSKPLPVKKAVRRGASETPGLLITGAVGSKSKSLLSAQTRVPIPAPSSEGEGLKKGGTLDGSWDRQLSRGLVSPDDTIDLHGHNLASAYALLDSALDRSIRAGDRLILLVTGKPPRAESERPHARGAIRAAVGDWLAGSRHAAAIAAVRGAHPRHGGAGALYIVLRRARGGR
jgi:DNA-nicking Smr family endonuclease